MPVLVCMVSEYILERMNDGESMAQGRWDITRTTSQSKENKQRIKYIRRKTQEQDRKKKWAKKIKVTSEQWHFYEKAGDNYLRAPKS